MNKGYRINVYIYTKYEKVQINLGVGLFKMLLTNNVLKNGHLNFFLSCF